jgi:DNA-binding LacI/PurR family transcriptional regulator
MIVLNRSIRHPNISCIIDLENATYRATRHLIDLKHKQIAYLGGPTASEQSQGAGGVESAMFESGLSLRPELCILAFRTWTAGSVTSCACVVPRRADRPRRSLT